MLLDIIGITPTLQETKTIFKAQLIETPLGSIIAVANEKALHLLEFIDRKALENEIKNLKKKIAPAIILGENKITQLIAQELQDYFARRLTTFKTPLFLLGSPFQKTVWSELQKIPYGTT